MNSFRSVKLKQIGKLASEDAAEDLNGEKEGILRMYPARVAWIETTGGNDAVEMRMQSQVLSPGMQNAEKADLGSEVLGAGRNFKHGLSAGTVEQIVEQPRMALTERVQLVGQGKDDVEVGYAEQILFAPCEPALASLGLALGTVAVATGVVGNCLVVATGAGVHMASERSGATCGDGSQHVELLIAKPGAVLFPEAVTPNSKYVGHLHGRPAHLPFPL
jgi:hypothetical protein